MADKQKILTSFRPRAILQALTREALRAIPPAALVEDMVAIRHFPFRIGRESRITLSEGNWHRKERPRNFDGTDHQPNNDIYLFDNGAGLQISREHMVIEAINDGWRVVDRGSACGTVVGGRTIGGEDLGGVTRLDDGDIIILGESDASPFRYCFIALD